MKDRLNCCPDRTMSRTLLSRSSSYPRRAFAGVDPWTPATMDSAMASASSSDALKPEPVIGVGTCAASPTRARRPLTSLSGTYSAIGVPMTARRSMQSRMASCQGAGQSRAEAGGPQRSSMEDPGHSARIHRSRAAEGSCRHVIAVTAGVPEVAVSRRDAPNVALGASDAPNATLGAFPATAKDLASRRSTSSAARSRPSADPCSASHILHRHLAAISQPEDSRTGGAYRTQGGLRCSIHAPAAALNGDASRRCAIQRNQGRLGAHCRAAVNESQTRDLRGAGSPDLRAARAGSPAPSWPGSRRSSCGGPRSAARGDAVPPRWPPWRASAGWARPGR